MKEMVKYLERKSCLAHSSSGGGLEFLNFGQNFSSRSNLHLYEYDPYGDFDDDWDGYDPRGIPYIPRILPYIPNRDNADPDDPDHWDVPGLGWE